MKANNPLKFEFITPFSGIPFMDSIKKGMNDAAFQLGVSCEFAGPEGIDTKAQAEMIRKTISNGIDGIAVNIFESEGLYEVLEEAHHNHIPVIAFNCDHRAVPVKRLGSVCQDLYKAGVKLGKKAATHTEKGNKVFITMHDAGISALEERCKGIADGLKTMGINYEVVIGGNAHQTSEIITRKLNSSPGVKLVIGTGQSDTEGAGLAIRNNFMDKGYRVAGFDLSVEVLNMINEGVIDFVIDQQPYIQGYYPVVQLFQYCKYSIAPTHINTGADIINIRNASRILELTAKKFR